MEWGPKHYVLGKGLLVKLSSFVPVSSPVISSLDLFTVSHGENSFESGKKCTLKIIHMTMQKVLLEHFQKDMTYESRNM